MEFKRSVKNKHKQKQKNIFFVAVIVFLKKIKIKKVTEIRNRGTGRHISG